MKKTEKLKNVGWASFAEILTPKIVRNNDEKPPGGLTGLGYDKEASREPRMVLG